LLELDLTLLSDFSPARNIVFHECRKLLWRAAISNRGQGGHPITKFGGGYDLSHVLLQLVHEVRRRTRRGEQPDGSLYPEDEPDRVDEWNTLLRRVVGQRKYASVLDLNEKLCPNGVYTNKIDGIKISLLSKEKEISMRRRLPEGVRMYTGDDFNYAELIAGDEDGYSDALLGIFDAIAPAASAGLARLANGDLQGFHGILEPTVPLSRHIFKSPTRFYKTGVVFLAWLNGLQDHFVMIGGQESARSLLHLAELFRLADKARVLHDPDLAAARMEFPISIGQTDRISGAR
jgi:hypothetical protein